MPLGPGQKRWLKRLLKLLMLAAGVALLAVLLQHTDTAEVWYRIRRAGWMFAAAFGAFVGTELFSSLAWRELVVARGLRVPFTALFSAFWSGEAVNYLLPAGALGEVMKGLFLRHHASRGALLETVVLFNLIVGAVVFGWVLVGSLLALMWLDVPPLVSLLSAGAAACMLCVLAVVRWLLARDKLGRWLAVLAKVPGAGFDAEAVKGRIQSMDERITALWRDDRPRFARMLAFMVAARVTTVLEVYLLLVGLMPLRGSGWLLALSLLVQTSTQVVMYVTLFVPGQIGTMEAGAAFIFAQLGLAGATGLAMELLRRARKILAIFVAACLGLVAKSRDVVGRLGSQNVTGR